MVKISVLMPVYKTPENYLREAIDSILAQTFTDFEFLILDDCPEQPVTDIVASYQDKRIIYRLNDKNMGISAARNKLIDMAQGEYLAVMDHDDISLPERFAKQAAYLDNHQDVGVVGSWTRYVISGKEGRNPVEHNDIVEALTYSCAIWHPSAMIRKSVLTAHNVYYDDYFSPAEDYALWCALSEKTKLHNLPEVLFQYRNHPNNTSHLQHSKMDIVSARLHALYQTKHPELWGAVKEQASFCYYVRLFKHIPLLTIIKTAESCQVKLFDCIPLLSVKIRMRMKK